MSGIAIFESPRWLRDLLRFLPLKSQFVLSGNIRDLQASEAGPGTVTAQSINKTSVMPCSMLATPKPSPGIPCPVSAQSTNPAPPLKPVRRCFWNRA